MVYFNEQVHGLVRPRNFAETIVSLPQFPPLIKDSIDNLFPQIHLHNTNAFFEDLTGKHFYNLAYKLHFLHTDLPTLQKRACFSTTIPPILIYLECSPTQCVIKK